MANEFYQTHQNFLPYESKFLSRSDIQGAKGKISNLGPEYLKSGSERDANVTEAASKGMLMEIIPMHIKNPPRITFMAFLEDFTDNFSPRYNSQNVFGRSDQYHIWQNTQRTIGLGVKVLSSGKNMALRNLANINWFLASLYPAYKESVGGSNSVSASPLFRVKYANMIMSANYSEEGLLGTLTGVRVGHNKKAGFIIINPGASGATARPLTDEAGELDPIGVAASLNPVSDVSRFEQALGQGNRPSHLVIPSEYTIRFQMTVIHEHPLGWNHETGEWRAYGPGTTAITGEAAASSAGSGGNGIIFPYGIELNKGLEDNPADEGAPPSPADAVAASEGDLAEEQVCKDTDGDGIGDSGNCAPSRQTTEEESFFGDIGGDGILDSFQLPVGSAFGSLGGPS